LLILFLCLYYQVLAPLKSAGAYKITLFSFLLKDFFAKKLKKLFPEAAVEAADEEVGAVEDDEGQ